MNIKHRPGLSGSIGLAVISMFLFFFLLPAWAGEPESAYYDEAADRIFWFIQISDIHINTLQSAGANLAWVVNNAKSVIEPEFIVASGDLVDATDGGLVPGDQSQDEWQTYYEIVTDAGMTPDFYFDLPGNHDHYNDKDFDYYLNNSIQGLATGTTQVSWRKDFSFGSYHFLGINTAGNDGAGFSSKAPYFGDHAGLDAEELMYMETKLMANDDADLSLIFGHHPLPQRPTGDWKDTYLSYGDLEFIQLMETFGVSVYAYGHTHQYREGLLPTNNSPGIFDLNIAPLGKEPPHSYQLFAVDCNGIATTKQPINTWPAVLITAPMDVKLGNQANPYAYSVNDLNPKPIRALVFDILPPGDIVVQYRIDRGNWHPMDHLKGPVWNALWDEPKVLDNQHTLEVRAIGTTTRSHTIAVGVPDPYPTDSGGSGGGSCFISSIR